MLRLLFVPESVSLLCQFLMAGVATAYVLSIPRKSWATRWLAATLGFEALFSLSYFLTVSTAGGLVWEFRFTLLLYVSIVCTMLAGIQFAYT
ncbi:MAG: hypothetical protein HKN04_13670, partial [Rhodothermaceae bacterium]|nr:hypothetical protein [Rhodothermaceae bacterium]